MEGSSPYPPAASASSSEEATSMPRQNTTGARQLDTTGAPRLGTAEAPRQDTTRAAENPQTSMVTQRIPDQQAKPIDPAKVSRVVRKSPVDGFDMQRFFGTYLRPKAFIDLPQKICKEGPAPKPRSTVASDDLGLPHEVVEAILSHLPIFDLITATGINMTFRTIVQNSPLLQRKLFLRPTQKPTRYVRVEHPDYGERTIIVEENGVDVDKHDDVEDSRDDPGRRSKWQWSEKLAVLDLCPFLHGYRDRSARDRVRYKPREKVHFSKQTVFAEHWADMYLTNPPCTAVIAHVSYHYGNTGGITILADRIVHCESGVTLASLLDVPNMEGDVTISRKPRLWGNYLDGRLARERKNTTINRELERLQNYGDGASRWPDEIELDWIDTVIEFPGVIFREWRAISDKCYVRSNDSTVSYRECQVTAEEEALHG